MSGTAASGRRAPGSPDREPARDDTALARGADAVLARNRRGAWTCPAVGFYPHQWLWDSCFVAIGLARTDPARAAGELHALLRGQWDDGMLPHMIFAGDTPDAGSRHIWQSRRRPHAPRHVDTSCITQPPVAAIATERVARALSPAARAAFLAEMVPALAAHHQWLYAARDPTGCGLVTLLHPWECGLDTTPPWMRQLRRMDRPWWLRPALRLRLSRVARLFRRDTRYAPAGERLSDDDGLRMLALVHRARRADFDLTRLERAGSVLVQDVTFHSLLVVANQALVALASAAGIDLPSELRERAGRSERALEDLWDEQSGEYCSRDARTGRPIRMTTLATFVPLWTGLVPAAREPLLLDRLLDPAKYWPRFPVPSVAVDAPQFDEDRYWRGPTWVNTNWIIVEALRRVGRHGDADELRERTLDLVARSGFAEYFSALTGTGHGAPEFSWTAALTLELLATRDRARGEPRP